MKILHTVENYYPSTGGMQEVVRELSERLVALGHDVTVATSRLQERTNNLVNGVTIKEFDVSGNMVRKMEGDIDSYKDFLLNSDYDVITNFAAQQWATDIMLPLLGKIKSKKVFVPTGFSALYSNEYKDYFERMKSWFHEYDMNVFLSENYQDINFARDCGVRKRVLIPNGAGENEFMMERNINIRKLLNIPEKHFLVLHVGSHTGIKGHLEAIKIFSRAHRLRSATFLLIANDVDGGCMTDCKRKAFYFNLAGKFLNKKIIITSLPRKETVAAYHEADLFLFPSNIECSPLVLFECMASKTPFLSTDVGNAAELVRWSNAGELLPTIKELGGYVKADIAESARRLEGIYRKSQRRREMQKSGHKVWLERFTWQKIALEYEKLYKELGNFS